VAAAEARHQRSGQSSGSAAAAVALLQRGGGGSSAAAAAAASVRLQRRYGGGGGGSAVVSAILSRNSTRPKTGLFLTGKTRHFEPKLNTPENRTIPEWKNPFFFSISQQGQNT
jgi:hypothetical protein